MFLEFLEAHAKEGGSLSTEALKALTVDEDSGVDDKDSGSESGEEDKEKKSVAFSTISDLEVMTNFSLKTKLKEFYTNFL